MCNAHCAWCFKLKLSTFVSWNSTFHEQFCWKLKFSAFFDGKGLILVIIWAISDCNWTRSIIFQLRYSTDFFSPCHPCRCSVNIGRDNGNWNIMLNHLTHGNAFFWKNKRMITRIRIPPYDAWNSQGLTGEHFFFQKKNHHFNVLFFYF